MMVPSHQSANYERTDSAITHLQGLAFALEALNEAHFAPEPNSPEGSAKDTILRLLIEQCHALSKLHSMEWVGLGGKSCDLTPDEAATARGEPQK